MNRIILALAFAIAAFTSTNALAWGAQGHRVTGAIADELLSAKARIEVNHLTGGASLASIATWMDEERRQLGPKVGKWHYDNVSVCGRPELECRNGDCLSQRLPGLMRTLKDRTAAPQQRAQALAMVVHMVGDLHQPLHSADANDRGGNDVEVLTGPRNGRHSLHEVWDTEILKSAIRGESEQAFVAKSVRSIQAGGTAEQWKGGTLNDWITDSNKLARDYAYGPLFSGGCGRSQQGVVLDERYLNNARSVVVSQVQKAGVRIAAVLNDALGR